MGKIMKIGIMGSGGSGKTITGFKLADDLGYEFLASRAITSEILRRDGYEHGVQVEKFIAQGDRQKEIMNLLIERELKNDDFITDRTSIDVATYALVEMKDSDSKALSEILEVCREHAKSYTHLFVCPWAGIDLRRNNLSRTINPHYQLLIHETQIGILVDWGLSFDMLEKSGKIGSDLNVEKRIEEIKKYL
jgi:adenylate kinase family enzyme